MPREPKGGQPEPWEERWSAGKTGWDQGQTHVVLPGFLASKQAEEAGIPTSGTALIPGCGYGYDVLLFAERGLDTTGLDISPTGVEAARKWLHDHASNQDLRSRTRIDLANFFEYKGSEGGYDLIYDYTFLCAIDPSLRPAWAKQMSALSLPSDSTRLITLMFPLNGGPGGPPFSLTEEIYHELLDPQWELVWSEEVPEGRRRKSSPPGGEKLGVWKRKM